MKTFKSVDVVIQLVTIVGGISVCLLDFKFLFYPYFIVGGWQLLSCLIHSIVGSYYPVTSRKYYLWTLGIIFLLGLITLVAFSYNELILGDWIFYYLEFLLIFSPIMAVWYCFICYKELRLYQQKEWIQLR